MTRDEERTLSVLMVRSQQGDCAAYERLLSEVREIARLFVRRRVGSVDWLEDAVQDILVAVHRGRHTWRPDRPFAPWLFAVVHRRFLDALRRERRRQRHEHASGAVPVVAVASHESAAHAGFALAAAVARLPPAHQRVVHLLKVEQHTVREVACALGLSEANVRVIAHRSLKHLRRLLEMRAVP